MIYLVKLGGNKKVFKIKTKIVELVKVTVSI